MADMFYLYNNYTGTALTLDPTISDYGLRAFYGGSDSALAFTFTPIPNTRFLKICTSISSLSYCLDVYGDQKTVPHLSEEGNYSGQQWDVITARGGLVKLSNQYTGTSWYLDVYSDSNGAFMDQGDYAGQYWKQVSIGSMTTSNPVESTTSAPSAAAAATTTISTKSSSTQSTGDTVTTSGAFSVIPPIPSANTSGLSTGAKAGIGAGCGALAILVGSLIFVILSWRRKSRFKKADNVLGGATTNEKKPVFLGQDSYPVESNQAYFGTAELPSPAVDKPVLEMLGQSQPVNHSMDGSKGHAVVHEMPGQDVLR
ncbi:hypothetical protein PSPO01_06855 [Paraphaeosphaeria sporulosa]